MSLHSGDVFFDILDWDKVTFEEMLEFEHLNFHVEDFNFLITTVHTRSQKFEMILNLGKK